MKKQLRNGKICVVHSGEHGAGWYSWHCQKELLFDPTIVEMVERNADPSEIEEYCLTAYSYDVSGLADGLTITYVDPGDRFYIHEYDGLETVVLESTFNWISAS